MFVYNNIPHSKLDIYQRPNHASGQSIHFIKVYTFGSSESVLEFQAFSSKFEDEAAKDPFAGLEHAGYKFLDIQSKSSTQQKLPKFL